MESMSTEAFAMEPFLRSGKTHTNSETLIRSFAPSHHGEAAVGSPFVS